MQTFRLAGVESQCVTRVLEGFGDKFFQYDKTKLFYSEEEAYEMAFLMIVLQTTEHNPNIKTKLQPRIFKGTCKDNCPKSWDNLPADYVETFYESIKAKEIASPISRSWYKQTTNEPLPPGSTGLTIQQTAVESDLNIC
jgi:Sec7-like guanine-nucleotide exchange factor